MASIAYNRFKYNLMKKVVDLYGDTINLALCTSSYTPDKDHNTWSQITNEVGASGTYASGGGAIGSKTVTQDDANDKAVWDGGDVTFTGATITARYGIVYDVTATSNLLLCVDFGSNVASTAGDWTCQWDSAGIASIS